MEYRKKTIRNVYGVKIDKVCLCDRNPTVLVGRFLLGTKTEGNNVPSFEGEELP